MGSDKEKVKYNVQLGAFVSGTYACICCKCEAGFIGDKHCVVCYTCALETQVEQLKEALGKIEQWVKAYPLSVFPEPDFTKAHLILKEHNISLDSISASNMRHVLKGVSGIVKLALHPEQKGGG